MANGKRGSREKKGKALSPPPGSPAPSSRKSTFPVVGIGASAGGLEALEQFFKAMPADSGLAFVVIVHLQSEQRSMLPELIGRHTGMEVLQAKEGMALKPDHVYVIPPGKELTVTDDILHEQPKKGTPPAPVDAFFRALARDRGENGICVVLSGMGSDGADGLRDIKAELGMVMAQEPASARFDSMPRRAIQTGLVDYVLPPAEMPRQLLDYVRHELPLAASAKDREQLNRLLSSKQEALQKIFRSLQEGTGQDFSGYKSSTLLRRLDRRLRIHKLESLEEYVRYLQQNPYEAKILQKELLISVTSFFRDPAAFAALKEKGIMPLLKAREEGSGFRVWVPGCATGEEAYSLAILIRECMEELGRSLEVQIFATDIDEEALEQGRQGRYPEGIAASLEPGRLERFFVLAEGEYRIRKEVREMMVFARQNVAQDPPFTRMDLLSCRNLLIYLGAELQQKLLPLFHFALKPDGLLFLGTAETAGQNGELFDLVDKKWRIYRRRETGQRQEVAFPVLRRKNERRPEGGPVKAARPRPRSDSDLAAQVNKILLRDFVPASVVTTRQGDILYIHGRTGKYLEPPPGDAHWNVLEMAREGLKLDLSTAFWRAAREDEEVRRDNLRVKTDGGFQQIDLLVRPLPATEARDGLLVIMFEEREPSAAPAGGGPAAETGPPAAEARIRELELELKRREENLQTAVEEVESTNEELQSANEEYQSTNEELQSTNEELESSREELQSLNEELVTINAELQAKVEEVETAYRELENFLDTIDIPILFLDNELRVTRYNAGATRIVALIESDLGRPLAHLASRLKYREMMTDVREVLKTMRHREQEVQTEDGRWFTMRIIPHRKNSHLEGVMITFYDIDRLKRTLSERDAVREALAYAGQIVDTVREPLLVLDKELRVQSANASFYRFFQVEPGETEGRHVHELGGGQWNIDPLTQLLEEVLPKRNNFEDFEVEVELPRLGRRRMVLNARRIQGGQVLADRILLALEDVTGL